MTDTRERFEREAKELGYRNFSLRSEGSVNYRNIKTQDAWIIWQACDALQKERIAELEAGFSQSLTVAMQTIKKQNGRIAELEETNNRYNNLLGKGRCFTEEGWKEYEAQQKERIAELEKDAERYRYLRNKSKATSGNPFVCIFYGSTGFSQWAGESADEKIDQAIADSK